MLRSSGRIKEDEETSNSLCVGGIVLFLPGFDCPGYDSERRRGVGRDAGRRRIANVRGALYTGY